MVTRIQSVTGRPILGNVAQRAYKTGDRDVVGGNPIPVYKVDDSELVENGGQFKVSGNEAAQFLVYEVSDETPLGGSALPIYIVNDTPPTPTAPTNLIATENGANTIDLTWTDNSTDETGFEIERRTLLLGAFALIHTTVAGVNSYSDSGLIAGGYEYRVRAINAFGASDYSNIDDGFIGAYNGISNLAHIYEPARRTLTSYIGPLIRLRRVSDNAQQDFSALGNGNLDTDAIDAFDDGSGVTVVTIYDQVGGNDPTQATPANQPFYVANTLNGHSVMTFDGSNDYLRVIYTSSPTQPMSVYAIARLDAGFITATTRFIMSGAAALAHALFRQSTGIWAINSGTALLGGAHNTNWNLWASLFNGVTSQFWVNDVSQASGNAGGTNATGITIGGGHALAAGTFWGGNIAAIIIVDPSHTTLQREELQDIINTFYAIY